MVDFVGIRKRNTIVPANPAALERLERVKIGVPLQVRVVFRRSVRFHNWYWSLVSVVAEGLGIHADGLHAELKFRTGMVDRVLTSKTFGVAVVLQSESFKSWDESKFREYIELAIPILFEEYLPGVKRADVYKRVEELTGDKCPF